MQNPKGLVIEILLSSPGFAFAAVVRGFKMASREMEQQLSAIVKFVGKSVVASKVKGKQVSAKIRLVVNAGQAKPAPPVGPALGQHRLNLMAFCKDFNARTQHIKQDVPMSVLITAYKDFTFDFKVKSPSVSYFLKKAAGLQKGGGRPGHDKAGVVRLQHVYEIAKIKQSDPGCKYISLEAWCKSVMGTARSMGIDVHRDLD